MNSVWQIVQPFGDKIFILPNLSAVFSYIHWNASHGTKHIAMFLPALIYSYSVKTVLEIGLANGFITQVLSRSLEANGGGKLISCDIDKQALELSHNFLGGLTAVEHIMVCADSTKVDFREYADAIDLCFIDGDHSYEATRDDIMTGINMGARIITVHDYAGGQPGVVQASDELLADWNKIVIPERGDTGDYACAIFQRR